MTGKAVGAKDASVQRSRDFVVSLKTIFVKPVKQVTHLGLALMILIVLASGIPTPKSLKETKSTVASVDPFGIESMTETTNAASKVTATDAVASIASVIDVSPQNLLAADAYKQADEQGAKSGLAVAADAIVSMPTIQTTSSAKGKATSTKYIVQGGDTLWSIARDFGITTDSIKWSNGITDENFVKPGAVLYIPSITGIIYTVKSGDTINGLASKYKAQASMIASQNDLIGNEDLVAGMQIVIPDGQIEEAAPAPAPSRSYYASSYAPRYIAPSSGSNRFPWGYCTYYVASRRNVPWSGNAWQWYGNAQAYGRSVGRTPVPGSILVTWESSVGHVAYVESVSGGSFTVSEMNYAGYGVVSRRTITTSSVPLIGFIY